AARHAASGCGGRGQLGDPGARPYLQDDLAAAGLRRRARSRGTGSVRAILGAASRRPQMDRCWGPQAAQGRQTADQAPILSISAARPDTLKPTRANVPMTALPLEKLDKLVQRWEELQAELNRGASPASYAQLTKEFAELNPVVESIRTLRKLED